MHPELSELPKGPIGFRLCHELEGLLHGFQADGHIHPQEVDRLVRWLADAAPYRDVRPFSELISHVDAALADGVISLDECEDLLFVTAKYTTVNPHFDTIRTGIQVLFGLVHGLAADRSVPEVESRALHDWIEQWSFLRGLWPFDECEAVAVGAINGRLNRPAVDYLTALTAQFPISGHVEVQTGEVVPLVIKGVCAVAPEIDFRGREFVFTGESERGPRSALEVYVQERRGQAAERVTKETDYLIVCDCGNPLWAFGCYGRKVEAAYNLRRRGGKIQIVHERDFWDAVAT